LHKVLVVIEYVFAVLAALIFLVITHELGHFIAARLAGVKCPEFFVGFGPRIWSTKRGDTEFGIKWILIGGYVKVLGMNPEEEISPEDFPHSYKGVSYGKRFWIIFSGSLVHLILALLIIFFTVWLIGVPFQSNTIYGVGQNMEGTEDQTPAYTAGLEPGDTILAMNGQPMNDWDDVVTFIQEHPNEEVTILVARNGQELELTATLAQRGDGAGYLGVNPQPEFREYSFLESFGETGVVFWENLKGVGISFSKLFSLSTFKQLLGISEPTEERPVSIVGITRLAGQLAGLGLYYFLMFFAFLLIFLALINLLPLPPLDGGHLMVLLWERVTGREVDLRKLYPVAVAVLAFFIILFILTVTQDIFNPVNLP
jgi:membrane-associated protease RseP (regulator of RpoE activity)